MLHNLTCGFAYFVHIGTIDCKGQDVFTKPSSSLQMSSRMLSFQGISIFTSNGVQVPQFNVRSLNDDLYGPAREQLQALDATFLDRQKRAGTPEARLQLLQEYQRKLAELLIKMAAAEEEGMSVQFRALILAAAVHESANTFEVQKLDIVVQAFEDGDQQIFAIVNGSKSGLMAAHYGRAGGNLVGLKVFDITELRIPSPRLEGVSMELQMQSDSLQTTSLQPCTQFHKLVREVLPKVVLDAEDMMGVSLAARMELMAVIDGIVKTANPSKPLSLPLLTLRPVEGRLGLQADLKTNHVWFLMGWIGEKTESVASVN